MLTDLIDHLDTLITQQKPISELKPRLAFLRDQAEALDRRVRALEHQAENDPLAAENERLRAQLQAALEELGQLKAKPASPMAESVPMRRSNRDLTGLL